MLLMDVLFWLSDSHAEGLGPTDEHPISYVVPESTNHYDEDCFVTAIIHAGLRVHKELVGTLG